MLRLTKRGKIWYVRGTIGGRRIYKTTKTSRKSEAEHTCLQWQKRLKSSPTSFIRALGLYLDAGGEERYTTQLLEHFKNTSLDEINGEVAIQAAHDLYPGTKNSTRNRQCMTPLKAIMRLASDHGLCQPVNIKNLKEARVERPTASIEWFEKFFKEANPNLTAICLFMAKTGRRVGEAVNLKWQDVDLKNGVAYLPTTKTGQPAQVHLTPDLVVCFANLENKERVFGYTSRFSINTAIRRACKRAKIPYLSTHELGRHTFATMYMKHCGNLKELMEAGDWKSINSVQKYIHIEPTEAKKLADKLPELSGANMAHSKK